MARTAGGRSGRRSPMLGDQRMSDPRVMARIADMAKMQERRVGREADAMSAVDEYRDPENGQWKTSLADAAIAELEAALADATEHPKTARRVS